MSFCPDEGRIYQLVYELSLPEKRATAMQELCKIRDLPPVSEILAPIMWNSFGTIASLLQEIICVYPTLTSLRLAKYRTGRVCNAVSLLQVIAQHSHTRVPFFQANILMFLYPLLNTTFKHRSFEYMRLTSLGVIGAVVKGDESEVINFLLSTELIPLCLRIMENGSDLSKTLATFIVEKILVDENGLNYVCATSLRFRSVEAVLANMILQIQQPRQYPADGTDQRPRLLKHIIRCYLRLTDKNSIREELKKCLPSAFIDGSLIPLIKDDASTTKNLSRLVELLS
ncbi:CCR4-NOT transcription complex subunit 9-like [Schistocerca gregaria]|uniref:CCR4-NOT transcription complex subunit 9-like n=1 Tax=Schistocerca gregaria TaxID=7010 RepID=UPI00211E18D0|nr:CCR4-NOT transcription complex subunit 9-like [Schistocerca gregaria]